MYPSYLKAYENGSLLQVVEKSGGSFLTLGQVHVVDGLMRLQQRHANGQGPNKPSLLELHRRKRYRLCSGSIVDRLAVVCHVHVSPPKW